VSSSLTLLWVLNRSLKKMIRAALPLISMPSTQEEDIVKAGEKFRSDAYEFHQLLALYRDHEAKEELHELLLKQLQKTNEVKLQLEQ
jgi:hypothetical protein